MSRSTFGLGVLFLAGLALAGCGASEGPAAPKNPVLAQLIEPPAPAPREADDGRGIATATAWTAGRCPVGMAEIAASTSQERVFCIDRWEASLVELLPDGQERGVSPFGALDGAKKVRAVSTPKVFPQGYISEVQAQQACTASGKRLCKVGEWRKACKGPEKKSFGYADRREPGRCNDKGRNPVIALFGRRQWNWRTMNQPQLNQLDGTLAKTGDHDGCTNGYGVYDMVGNLHEWVADPQGTFFGGYYQDVSSVGHGEGCGYLTTAHEARYHDYSTGFRCCADAK